MGSTCTCAHRIRMSEAQNACLRVCLIALSFDGSGMHTTAACCEYLRRRRVKTIKESVESCPLNLVARHSILLWEAISNLREKAVAAGNQLGVGDCVVY